MHTVFIRDWKFPFELLEFDGQLLHGLSINQLAQFRCAEQFPQLSMVERQGRSTALGQRRIAVVDEVSHIIKQQRRSERRCRPCNDLLHANGSLFDILEQRAQSIDVEYIPQAFPIRFQHDRKLRISRRHREQVSGLSSLKPKRSSLSRLTPWQQESPSSIFSEASSEQRGRTDLPNNIILNSVRCWHQG